MTLAERLGRLAPHSLSGRVTLAAVAAVGVALALAGAGVVIAAGRADRSALDRDLNQLVMRLDRPAVRFLAGTPAPKFMPAPRAVPPPIGPGSVPGAAPPGAPPSEGEISVDAGGTVIGPDGGIRRRAPQPALDPGSDRFARVVFADGQSLGQGTAIPAGFPIPAPRDTPTSVEAGGEDWRTVTRQLPDGRTLQVAARLEPLQADARRLLLVVFAALGAALLATALVTRSLAGLALAPLARLRRTAGDVAVTADLEKRLPVGDGPEEVDALAGDLNAMLARLGAAAAGQRAALDSARRFAADAGHELRTPLTSLEANLATGSVGAARGDARRLTALVEQLQALARGEAGPPASPEPVDLAELADAAILDLQRRHPEIQARLDAAARGPVVAGEPESLRMMLDNLLENSARHGRRGGHVRVTLRGGEDGIATVLVDDDGPGIAVAERDRVLDRFARGSGASGEGTGLGLAIAAAQAARHGGSLTLEDSDLGGLRARVELRGAGAGPA